MYSAFFLLTLQGNPEKGYFNTEYIQIFFNVLNKEFILVAKVSRTYNVHIM